MGDCLVLNTFSMILKLEGDNKCLSIDSNTTLYLYYGSISQCYFLWLSFFSPHHEPIVFLQLLLCFCSPIQHLHFTETQPLLVPSSISLNSTWSAQLLQICNRKCSSSGAYTPCVYLYYSV